MPLSVDIEKTLGSFHLRVRFEAGQEVLALLGASGCGKSMTLKCIAGIETPDRGKIVLNGVTLFDSQHRINLPPQKRRVGYLFQQYALFPHMTVAQNIAAGVRDRDNRDAAVRDMIRAMRLDGLEQKKPHQLSGGQQQRVALARILVNEPEVLLLDEPFSALDTHLRFQLEQELRDTISRFGKTVLLVSHNRDEVFRLCDRIAVLADGRVETCGSRHDVFADPKTRNGAILTGCKNISALQWQNGTQLLATDWGISLTASHRDPLATAVGIRMHDLQPGPGENAIRFRVVQEVENPFSYTLLLQPLHADVPIPLGWETDKQTWNTLRAAEITLRLPPESLLLLHGEGEDHS